MYTGRQKLSYREDIWYHWVSVFCLLHYLCYIYTAFKKTLEFHTITSLHILSFPCTFFFFSCSIAVCFCLTTATVTGDSKVDVYIWYICYIQSYCCHHAMMWWRKSNPGTTHSCTVRHTTELSLLRLPTWQINCDYRLILRLSMVSQSCV